VGQPIPINLRHYSAEILPSCFLSSRLTTPKAASASRSETVVSFRIATTFSFFNTLSGSMIVMGLFGSWRAVPLGVGSAGWGSGSGVMEPGTWGGVKI